MHEGKPDNKLAKLHIYAGKKKKENETDVQLLKYTGAKKYFYPSWFYFS